MQGTLTLPISPFRSNISQLNATEFKLWCYLAMQTVGQGQKYTRESQYEMSRALGICPQTVNYTLKKLRDRGYIAVVSKKPYQLAILIDGNTPDSLGLVSRPVFQFPASRHEAPVRPPNPEVAKSNLPTLAKDKRAAIEIEIRRKIFAHVLTTQPNKYLDQYIR